MGERQNQMEDGRPPSAREMGERQTAKTVAPFLSLFIMSSILSPIFHLPSHAEGGTVFLVPSDSPGVGPR